MESHHPLSASPTLAPVWTRNASSCLKSVQKSTRQELEGLFWKLQCNAIKSVEKPQKQLTMQADSQPQSKQMDQFDGLTPATEEEQEEQEE